MTPTEFSSLADAYGGDIANWPSAKQEDARLLGQRLPELQALLNDQRALDAVLAAWTVPEPGASLTGQIVTILTAQRARAKRVQAWLSGLAAALTLATGVAAGAFVVTISAGQQPQSTSPLYQLTVLGAPLDLQDQAADRPGS